MKQTQGSANKRPRLLALVLLLSLLSACASATAPVECPAPALQPWTAEQELKLADEIDSLDLDANYPMIGRALLDRERMCAEIKACDEVEQ